MDGLYTCDYCDEQGYDDDTFFIYKGVEYTVHDYCERFMLKSMNLGRCSLCDYAYSLDDLRYITEGADHTDCWNDFMQSPAYQRSINGNR